jgi:leucyl/phenylalanyl-tRNA--protein transferase
MGSRERNYPPVGQQENGMLHYRTSHGRPALLGKELWFPDPCSAAPDGLVAVGGDLSIPRLLLAYRSGIFPWTIDPVTWWSPDPRATFELDQFHVPRSLSRTIRKGAFRITTNRAFQRVIVECGNSRRGGTWITSEFVHAYTALHQAGYAHSLECWNDDQMVGGIYGVAVGGLFAGESMFHRVSDAAKVALYYLIEHLRHRRFALFDIQMLTPITRQLGARTLPRPEYLRRLNQAVELSCRF